MKVILLSNVPKIGKKDDVKDLKDGYAQNALIAKGLAILATPQALNLLNERKNKLNQEKKKEEETFLQIIKEISDKKIEIKAKVNEKGHLFKTINTYDVIKAIKDKMGLNIEEKDIEEVHIKETGIFPVKIKRNGKSGICQIEVKRE